MNKLGKPNFAKTIVSMEFCRGAQLNTNPCVPGYTGCYLFSHTLFTHCHFVGACYAVSCLPCTYSGCSQPLAMLTHATSRCWSQSLCWRFALFGVMLICLCCDRHVPHTIKNAQIHLLQLSSSKLKAIIGCLSVLLLLSVAVSALVSLRPGATISERCIHR